MVNALFLENWTVTTYEETETALTVQARYEVVPESCPHCGVVGRLYKHGSEVVPYTDAPTFGLPCTLVVTTQRLRCRECSKTFVQPLPDMAPGRRLTNRCVRYIEREIVTETWAKIARNVGIDEKTVRAIAKAVAQRQQEEHRPYAPLILGIDELRLHGDLRTIFTDSGHRRVLDILPSQDKRLVHHWLSWLPERDRVRIVTTDMYAPYRDVVRQLMPNALLIVDRWHVQKEIGRALDRVRVRLAGAQRSKKAKREAMRGRRLLQRSRHRLGARAAFVLDGWLANNPVLKDAWQAKEAFYDVWESRTILEAETRFLAARDALPETVRAEFGATGFSGTIERWWEHVFPFFEFRYTNAYTEAANGIIKIANRAGRGYKFEQIRSRALAMARKPPRGPQIYVCEECLKRFPAEDNMFFHLGVTLCAEHAEFHVWDFLRQLGHSTPKSG